MTLKLTLELIPEMQWGQSLARLLPTEVWDSLRREIYQKFNYECAICSGSGRMNCHEVWTFDDKNHIQFLKGLQSLCDDCHMIRHWGRTVAETQKGTYPKDTLTRLTRHFCEVNECTVAEFEEHKVEMGSLWLKRSGHHYKIDFGLFKPETLVKTYFSLKRSARNSRR